MADKNGREYEKYNHPKAIRQQIKYVNQKIGEADVEDKQSFNQYFTRVLMSLGSLDAMIDPFKDEKFDDKLSDFEPKSSTRSEKLSLIRDELTEIYNLMDRQNIFYHTKHGRTKV